MTISQLEYVLAVAKHQNFTEAAKHCFVTQPTLSMQIQKLEEELEIKIFNRKKKPIALTDIGERIVEQAKIIVDESQRMNDIVDQQKGYIGGVFKVGIIPTIIPTLLPMFLKIFIKKYPKVNLVINELTTEEIIQQLVNGNIDVGIAATPLENEAIKERVLYYEPFVGYVPETHRLFAHEKLAVNDLEIDEILLLQDGHCFKQNIINLCNPKNNLMPKHFELESGSFTTLIKLAKEGLGMTLLPYLDSIELPEKERKHLRDFEKPVPAREVSLVYHKSQLKIQMVEALKTCIDSVVRGAISFNDVKIVSPL
jgi:LysR family hydrogen peroxide-inducible transcriptional activator